MNDSVATKTAKTDPLAFLLAFLAGAFGAVGGAMAALFVGLESSSLWVGVMVPGALLFWLIVACVRAVQRGAWSGFWGLIAGTLAGVVALVVLVGMALSHMTIGGF